MGSPATGSTSNEEPATIISSHFLLASSAFSLVAGMPGSLAVAFANDYAQGYRPRPADRIYASTYQALNCLELGDLAVTRRQRLRDAAPSLAEADLKALAHAALADPDLPTNPVALDEAGLLSILQRRW